MVNLMSGSLRVGSTAVLGVLRSLGQLFSIVVVQLLKYVQKLDDDEALTRSVRLSYKSANSHDMVKGRCCKRSAQMDLPNWYFLHKHYFGPET